eukprot:6475482-Amphidinium_carterae.1
MVCVNCPSHFFRASCCRHSIESSGLDASALEPVRPNKGSMSSSITGEASVSESFNQIPSWDNIHPPTF